MSNEQAKFLTGNLTKHIVTMSVTASIGFIALFIVDLVDMLFISMLGIDELAAAVGFAGAILFMTTSLSIGLGIAGGAMVAKALGEGSQERAKEVLTHVLIIGFLFAVVVASLIYWQLEALTSLVGATGNTQQLAISYLQYLVPTMPILMLGIVASAALRSHGAAKQSMWVTLIAGVVNAILDPIFIFGLDMGLDGAAIASAISRLAMAGVAMWYIFARFGGLTSFRFGGVLRDFMPITTIALPAMLANVATPIGSAYVTRAASSFGEEAVAGMAIIGRVTPIAFAMIFAMSGAIGPIIGQNFGAQQFTRVREAFNRSIILIVVYVFPVVAVLYLLRAPIADMFNASGTSRELIYLFCGPISLAWIFNGIIFIGNASYNNLGHPFYSTWVNWGRNTLGIFPFVYFGAELWGASGVLIGQMTGGIFVAIFSFILAERLMRKTESAENVQLEEHSFKGHRRDFTMLNHRR